MRSLQRMMPALALVGLALAACSSDGGGRAADPAPRSSSSTATAPTAGAPTSAPAEAAIGPDDIVEGVVFSQADLDEAGTVELYQHGDDHVGQVTLDNCGYEFRTEEARTARRQVAIKLDAQPEVWFSNEVVTYVDEATAVAALEEMRASVDGCDSEHFVTTGVVGPPVRFEVKDFEPWAIGYPVDDVVTITERITRQGYDAMWSSVVYQRSANVLDAHYVLGPTRPTRELIATLVGQAKVTGSRMLARSA